MIKEATNMLQLRQEHECTGHLSQRIHATLWFTYGSAPPTGRAVLDLMPTPSVMLHIQYGAQLDTASMRITGPHATHVPWLLRPGHELFTLVFKPHAWAAITDTQGQQLVNACLPGDKVFAPQQVKQLLQKMVPYPVQEPQRMVLDWLAEQWASRSVPPLTPFDKVLDAMEAQKGIGKVEDYLQPDTHIRTLQRYCKKMVGMAPKTILALIRHRHVLLNIASNKKERWQDIVQEGFFYDQSHYRRVRNKFRKPGLLTGCEAIP